MVCLHHKRLRRSSVTSWLRDPLLQAALLLPSAPCPSSRLTQSCLHVTCSDTGKVRKRTSVNPTTQLPGRPRPRPVLGCRAFHRGELRAREKGRLLHRPVVCSQPLSVAALSVPSPLASLHQQASGSPPKAVLEPVSSVATALVLSPPCSRLGRASSCSPLTSVRSGLRAAPAPACCARGPHRLLQVVGQPARLRAPDLRGAVGS